MIYGLEVDLKNVKILDSVRFVQTFKLSIKVEYKKSKTIVRKVKKFEHLMNLVDRSTESTLTKSRSTFEEFNSLLTLNFR